MSLELELTTRRLTPTATLPVSLRPDRTRTRQPRTARVAPSLRRFLLFQGLSQGADAATTVTLAQVVVFSLERGATPATVVRALATGAVPYFLALPVAGLISDRWARRRTLAVAQVLRALLTLGATAVPLTRSIPLGYAFVIALLATSGFCTSVRSASLPHVVDPQRLVAANSWSSLVAKFAGMLALAGAVVVGRSHPVPFLVFAAALHLLAAVGFGTWRRDLGGHGWPACTIHFGQILRRASSLVTSPPVSTPVRAALGHRLLQGATMMTFVVIAEERFHLGASGYATAIGATAVGTFLGTAITPALLARHSPDRCGVVAWMMGAAALLVAFLLMHPAAAIVALVVVGGGFQVARLLADTTVQVAVLDDALGRVYSLYDASFHVALLSGAVLAFLVPGLGSAPPLLALALLHLTAGLLRHRTHLVGKAS
ncbi:MAG: MFS transporter [Actinomycetota bacterium]|nr:MFS transporter [Actinomycetota bacterium]